MLSLERYAIIRASIEKSGDRDRVLAASDILPREWLLCERRWHRELAAEVARGRRDLAARYLAAFSGALGPLADSVTPAQTIAPAVTPKRAPSLHGTPLAAPARAMPSYLATPRLAAVAEPPRGAPSDAKPAALPSTGELDNSQLRRPVTPFAVGSVQATTPAAMFSSPPPGSPPPPAPPRQSAGPLKSAAETAYLDASQLNRPPTPFIAAPGERRPPSPVSSTSPPAPAGAGTGTAIVDEVLLEVPPPTVPPDLPSLTVDQYAWVTATLKRTKPEEVVATLTRLRLTAASRVSLDAIWKAHMARHPAAKQAFILALGKHLSPP